MKSSASATHHHLSFCMMTFLWKTFCTLAPICLAALMMLTLTSCPSSHGIKGIPENLTPIAITGSTKTPPHRMASYEYPFDSNGQYIADWAAAGERRAGRSVVVESPYSRKRLRSHRGSAASKSQTRSRGSRFTYLVKRGDTLSRIATRYGTSVAKIKKANALSSNMISPGQKLRIPR